MEDKGDVFTFENLGGGQEVGRSCHVIQFKGKCVMVMFKLAFATVESSNEYSWMQESILRLLVLVVCRTMILSI